MVIKLNSLEGLKGIIEQTHIEDEKNQWHTLRLIERVQCPILLIGGEHDGLAPPSEVKDLFSSLQSKENSPSSLHIIKDSGHMMPIEKPVEWRNTIISFLDR